MTTASAAEALSQAQSMIVALDRRGRVTFLNPAALEALGRPGEDLVGADWFDVCVPEAARRAVRSAFGLLMDGRLEPVETYENAVLRADGSELNVAWRNTLLREGSRLLGTLSMGTPQGPAEATPRPRSGARVRLDTARRRAATYQKLFDDAPVGYLIHEADGAIRIASARAAELLGTTPQDVAGQALETLAAQAADPRGALLGAWERVTSGTDVRGVVWRVVRPDGALAWLRLDMLGVRDSEGKLVEARTALLDISVEHELQTRARLYAAIVDAMPIGVAVLAQDDPGDPESFRFVARNPAAERLGGPSPDDPLGRLLRDVAPDAIASGLHEIYAVTAADRVPRRLGEVPFTWADGRPGCLLTDVFPLPGGQVAVAVQDISERHEAERARARLTEELARSNADLEQFAHVASHDLQEPLRKITAFGDRLARTLEGQLDAKSQDHLQRMVSAASRMQELIDALLEFARVSRRGHAFEPVDLGVTVGEVLEDLAHRVDADGVRLEVGELPTVRGDARQMRRLIQNLLANGLKYVRPGEAAHVRVAGRLLADGRHAELTVQDHGIGFDPADAERIFAPFHRLHGRSEYTGTGMGLAICRRIVDRHGGSIVGEGKPGAGSRFVVTLPAAQRTEEP